MGLDAFKNALAEQVFGRKREEGKCVMCGKDVDVEKDYQDELSRKEYEITFMCQECQDSVFEGEEE